MTFIHNRIDCALFRADTYAILIPAVCIAEVLTNKVSDSAPLAEKTEPQKINWRDKTVNVVSFTSEFATINSETNSIVVILRFPNNSQFDFAAIAAQEIPKIVTIHEHNIETNLQIKISTPFAACYALYSGEEVIIPDLTKIVSKSDR